MTHPGAPRDVDLGGWLNQLAFHPANTKAKQLGHEYVRSVMAGVGAALHDVLPPGADKSVVYRLLGEVVMYANRALAVGGGPMNADETTLHTLRAAVDQANVLFETISEDFRQDSRVQREYKAEQVAQP